MGKKLTNSAVEAFKGGAVYTSGKRVGQLVEHAVLWDGELIGFGVRYAIKSGTRTYIFQGRVKGIRNSERTITIGRHNDPWRVDQARARALELKAAMLSGIDPVAEVKRKQAESEQRAVLDRAHSATLRQTMTHYIENKRTKHGPLRPKTKESIRDTIERYLPDWLDTPMAATVTRDACLVRFAELSDTEINLKTGKKGKKGASNLTFVYLRAICNHARELYSMDNGEFTIFATNPVSRMVKVRKLNPGKSRSGRIPKDRIGHVWLALEHRRANARDAEDRTAADWVSTILLTGLRKTESGALKHEDVNLDAKTIRLRGDVEDAGDGFAGVKNHHEMVLPMSTLLHEILSARKEDVSNVDPKILRRRHVQRSRKYVFASCGKKTPYMTDARATMEAVSEAAGRHVSYHDLRRTYEDCLKFAKVDPDERRLLTNHLAKDVHQESYSNDEDPETLRPAVEAAAQWIFEQARIAKAQQSGANIIAFPVRA